MNLQSKHKAPKVAVVIPARNEAATVGAVAASLRSTLEALGFVDFSLLVIDDHSTDGTSLAAKSVGAEVLPLGCNGGLASAFRLGIDAALRYGADIIVHIDADGQYLASDLPAMFNVLDRGADLVVGNRLGKRPYRMTRRRHVANRLASWAISEAIGIDISDTQSGLRVFSARAASEIEIRGNFTYTQEQLVRAAHQGFGIAESPISFLPRVYGRSRLVRSLPDYSVRVVPHLAATIRELRKS